MKPTIALTLLGVALLGAMVAAQRSKRGERPPRVRLEGDAVKLLSGHRVTFHSSRREVEPFTVAAEEFPLEVATKDFGAAFLDIQDQGGERVASIILTRPLMERFRDTFIRLDKPTFQTRIHRNWMIDHAAWIGDEVKYASLPRWNRRTNRLTEAAPPRLEIRLRGESEKPPLVTQTMDNGGVCRGCRWFAFVDLPEDVPKGTELSIRIMHDTGDLFGKLTSVTHHVVQ
jgi:hypothetical protein